MRNLLLLLAISVGGCAYSVKPEINSHAIGPSSLSDKHKGLWRLELSDRLTNLSDEVKPYTNHCSGMKYPILVGQSLANSIQQAIASNFERIDTSNSGKTVDGTITVSIDDFQSRAGCFALLQCKANTQLTIHINVKRADGTELADKSIQTLTEHSGFEGMACEGVSNILSKSVSSNLSDSVGQVSTFLSGLPK